MRIKLVFS